jgi:hypothetical protein
MKAAHGSRRTSKEASVSQITSNTLAFGVREIKGSFTAFGITSVVTIMVDVDCPDATMRQMMESGVHEVIEKTLATFLGTMEQQKAKAEKGDTP